jgi:hypothetical protein
LLLEPCSGDVVPKWEAGLQMYLLAQEMGEFSMVADVGEKANDRLAENTEVAVSMEVFRHLLKERELLDLEHIVLELLEELLEKQLAGLLIITELSQDPDTLILLEINKNIG